MRLVIRGHDLPGTSYDGHVRVAVGLQVRDEPTGLVPGDASDPQWETDVRLVDGDARGPAVHGRRGDRFVYLTWGEVSEGGFAMFRRAKLMLDRIESGLVAEAEATGRALVADVGLTDEKGGPRCARVDPPAVRWSLAEN